MGVAGSPTESRQTFTRSDEYVGDRVVIPLKPFFVASNLVPHRRAIEELKRSEPLAFLWTNDGQSGRNPNYCGGISTEKRACVEGSPRPPDGRQPGSCPSTAVPRFVDTKIHRSV